MICISIAQESRRLALADMLNAARQCDLLEVRLDRFGKAPELGELLAAKPRPVIMCCRRPQDGGQWDGSEDERLAILRQCIISKAEYVEIELDAADQIRRFPPTKRVISYTNLEETPSDIADIFAEMQTKSPDVIKLTTRAETPEAAWPLVQILARATVPTVVVGLGKPGVMLGILGKKIGAPWTYAALERGMEAYPGQPTVRDLVETYHYREVEKQTRFVGVTGFDDHARATVAGLNAAFAHLNLPARCLPLGVGSLKLFRKIIEAVKLAAVVLDEEHRGAILGTGPELDPSAARSGAADVILHKGDKWYAHDTQTRATIAALETAARTKHPGDHPLKGRLTMVIGANATAEAMACALKDQEAAIIVASHDRARAQKIAQAVEGRHILFEAVFTTMHDVLVVCDEEKEQTHGKSALHTSFLKPGMTVLDLTATVRLSPLVRVAMERGCAVVTPQLLWLDQIATQAHLLTGKELPREVFEKAVPWLLEEE
jgi:3-dehydroquinate dehydratase/shikimate dehydrogenase